MIERIHLQIFREVDRQGSLTAAAERLYLTQSALSHSIRKLEDRLGTPLWRRDGKRLIPTQAGEYMLSLAHRLLPQLEHAEGRLQQFALGERGSLRIGMECHPCYQWLLRQVSPYLARWPDVELDVKQKFQFGGIGALFAFEIDVLVTPDPLYKPGLHYEPVFDYEQVLVVGREHALAQRASVVPGDLADEVLLSYPVPPERLDVFNQFLTPAGVAPASTRRWKTRRCCCSWWPAIAVSPPCPAGSCKSMPLACPLLPSVWARRALPNKSTWASAVQTWTWTTFGDFWTCRNLRQQPEIGLTLDRPAIRYVPCGLACDKEGRR